MTKQEKSNSMQSVELQNEVPRRVETASVVINTDAAGAGQEHRDATGTSEFLEVEPWREVIYSVENGQSAITNALAWMPLNLVLPAASSITLRRGDALLLAAAPEGVTTGVSTIAIGGSSNYTLAATERVAHRFDHAGTFTVSGEWSGATNGQVVVKVLAADFGDEPAFWAARTRSWTCTNLPPDVVVEADPRLRMTNVTTTGSVRTFQFRGDEREERRIVARTAPGGAILAATKAKGFFTWSTSHTLYQILEQNPDGSRVVSMLVVQEKPDPAVEIRLSIFVGGVTFDDGTTLKSLQAADFNAQGEAWVVFHMAPGVLTSYCHKLYAYQNGLLIGTR